jgi:hypothetical protein
MWVKVLVLVLVRVRDLVRIRFNAVIRNRF